MRLVACQAQCVVRCAIKLPSIASHESLLESRHYDSSTFYSNKAPLLSKERRSRNRLGTFAWHFVRHKHSSSEACCAHVECTSVVVSLDMGCVGMSLRGGRKGVRAQWSVTLVTQGQAQGRPRLNPFSAMQNWCRLAGSIALCLPLPSSHLIFIANLQYQNGGHHHELCAEQHQTEPGNCLSQPLCWGACPAGSRMHTGNCTPCERGGNKGAVHPEQKRRELLPSSPHVHVSSVSSCWAPSASRVW